MTMVKHYARLQPQTIERLQDVMTPDEFRGFCRGNVLKYAERAGHKDETLKEVLKLIDYAHWWAQSLQGQKVSYGLKEDSH